MFSNFDWNNDVIGMLSLCTIYILFSCQLLFRPLTSLAVRGTFQAHQQAVLRLPFRLFLMLFSSCADRTRPSVRPIGISRAAGAAPGSATVVAQVSTQA
jgi:hypothetical protein